jgi:hypothetical protein
MIKKRELEFPWMNLHHRVLEADGHRINQGQVGQSYRDSHNQEETDWSYRGGTSTIGPPQVGQSHFQEEKIGIPLDNFSPGD